MKRLICLILSVLFLFLVSSCFLLEKKEVSEDNSSLNSTKPGDLVDTFRTANITVEKLEAESALGHMYVFSGIKIQKDNGISAETTKEILQSQIESSNLCPAGGTDLELQFPEMIPQSVTWYNHYYMDAKTKAFIFSSIQQNKTVDTIEAAVVLPIGVNLAKTLDSNLETGEAYRIIRIVCEFDDQIIEYYIFSEE